MNLQQQSSWKFRESKSWNPPPSCQELLEFEPPRKQGCKQCQRLWTSSWMAFEKTLEHMMLFTVICNQPSLWGKKLFFREVSPQGSNWISCNPAMFLLAPSCAGSCHSQRNTAWAEQSRSHNALRKKMHQSPHDRISTPGPNRSFIAKMHVIFLLQHEGQKQ